MAQPVWNTDSGSLGTIEEGRFFQLPLLAEDPDSNEVYFTLIAGELPNGIQVAANGLISGVPKAIANVQGVPTEVSENVTSQFSVRAYTKTVGGAVDRLNDRTFEITVTGQDVPEFTTPAGEIGRWFDGDRVSYQIQFSDDDPSDTVTISVASGSLPEGLTISNSGVISGYIEPIDDLDSAAITGWDGYDSDTGTYARWDQFPFDFSTRSINKNYEFTLKITDGKQYNTRSFSMYVYSRNSLTADNDQITIDTLYITADDVATRNPYISNYPANGVLDAYRHDNFYAYRLIGENPDGGDVTFTVVSGDLPPGLSIDPDTGYLFGYIPNIGFRDITYNFTVRIAKATDAISLRDFDYSINIYGNIDTDVTWLVDPELGSIVNGEVSTLYVRAEHSQGISLRYRLKSGATNSLPQGLSLNPSGNLAGRVSYKTFSLDDNTTTFDKNLRTRLDIDETTFDRTFTFTVQAYNTSEIVNVERTFTITVDHQYDKPCQCMRIEAFPPEDDRDLIASLVNNSDIFKPEWIYRPDDPWFGVHKKVWYEHAYGLEPSTFAEYTSAIIKNHYRKHIVLGEIKTAQALDDNDNILYEVVYSNVVDTAVNNNGESAAIEQTLKYPVNAGDSTEIDTVYPNSLENMRSRVIDNIGQVAPILPRWMLSKQSDGEILGFTRAWVLCYTIPGKSNQIKYEIEQQFGTQLNKIDFDADRYVLGWYSANNWDSANDSWKPAEEYSINSTFKETTFDYHTEHDVSSSSDYVNDRDSLAAENRTEFDGSGTRFIQYVDKHEYTDVYDKYLIFPQQRIIDNGE